MRALGLVGFAWTTAYGRASATPSYARANARGCCSVMAFRQSRPLTGSPTALVRLPRWPHADFVRTYLNMTAAHLPHRWRTPINEPPRPAVAAARRRNRGRAS